MYNRNRQDVADERTDVPEIYEQNRERLTRSDAELRSATDPVSGTPSPTEAAETVADGVADENADRREDR
jgi:hypothetical protein